MQDLGSTPVPEKSGKQTLIYMYSLLRLRDCIFGELEKDCLAVRHTKKHVLTSLILSQLSNADGVPDIRERYGNLFYAIIDFTQSLKTLLRTVGNPKS